MLLFQGYLDFFSGMQWTIWSFFAHHMRSLGRFACFQVLQQVCDTAHCC